MKNITIENIKENVAKLIKAYVKNGGHAIKGEKGNIELIAQVFADGLRDFNQWEKEGGKEEYYSSDDLGKYYFSDSFGFDEEHEEAQGGLGKENLQFDFRKGFSTIRLRFNELNKFGLRGCNVSLFWRKMGIGEKQKTDLILTVGENSSIYIDGGKVKYSFE